TTNLAARPYCAISGKPGCAGRMGPPQRPGSPHTSLQNTQEGDEIRLLLLAQFQLQHQVEELNRVFQRQQAPVVEVRRAVLDAAQRKRLDRAVGAGPATVDVLLVVEPLR